MQRSPSRWGIQGGLLGLMALPGMAAAADFDGAQLSAVWGIPFAGILLSIALAPLLLPHFWHHHYGKVAAAWSLAFLVPFAAVFGTGVAGGNLVHALLAEYIPFIVLLTALFTVSGGIYIRGNLHGSPGLNTSILAIGAVLASFMGTTGASMLMIRPLIRANDNRKHVAHVVVDGAIDTDFIRTSFPERYALKDQDGILNPDHIADNYWHLHAQPRDAWTHELDLRPWMERW